MPTATEFAVANARQMREFTLKMLADVPANKLAAQFQGIPNHFLWTFGHLAVAGAFFGSCIEAKVPEPSEAWNKLFAPGSQPSPNAADYPPLAEILAFHDQVFAAFEVRAKELTDKELGEACPNGGGGGFLKHRMDAILTFAWHEGWHAGQLSDLRRALGLKGVFGT